MEEEQLWFAMRDQHRGLSSQYMYEHLAAQGFETYTPTVKKSKLVKGHAVIDGSGQRVPLVAHE